jgi:hypothetical protein
VIPGGKLSASLEEAFNSPTGVVPGGKHIKGLIVTQKAF